MNCLGFMEQKVFSIWTILELSLCTFTGWNLDVGFLYSFCLAFNGSFDLKRISLLTFTESLLSFYDFFWQSNICCYTFFFPSQFFFSSFFFSHFC